MVSKEHFLAGNQHEGCGHRHTTKELAKRCATKYGLNVYRVWYVNGKRKSKKI